MSTKGAYLNSLASSSEHLKNFNQFFVATRVAANQPKKDYMKRFVMLCLLALLAPFAVAAQDFIITGESVDQKNIRVVKVDIPERITEQEITEIAKKIHLKGYRGTLIHFSLRDGSSFTNWAVANFTPELEVRIFGPSDKTLGELLAHKPKHEGERIGSWLNTGDISYRITIAKVAKDTFTAYLYFSDGGHDTETLKAKTVNGQVRYYVEPSMWKKYYTVGADGRLQYWEDRRGMYRHLAPVN